MPSFVSNFQLSAPKPDAIMRPPPMNTGKTRDQKSRDIAAGIISAQSETVLPPIKPTSYAIALTGKPQVITTAAKTNDVALPQIATYAAVLKRPK